MHRLLRAFIALPVAMCGGAATLERLCAGLPARNRPQRPTDLHITLAFLGDCEGDAAFAAWNMATQSPPAAARLRLARAALLGDGRAAGFDLEPAAPLEAWMQRHRDTIIAAATAAGTARLAVQPTPVPRPHVTVAWLYRRPPPELASATLHGLAVAEGRMIRVDRLALWCRGNDPENDRRRYRSLREIALPATAG